MKCGTFSFAAENPPVPGCTISGEVVRDTFVFSLAEDTDISPESYPVCKLWLAARGEMAILADGNRPFHPGDLYVTPMGTSVGVRAETESVYGSSAEKGDCCESHFERRRGIRPKGFGALAGG